MTYTGKRGRVRRDWRSIWRESKPKRKEKKKERRARSCVYKVARLTICKTFMSVNSPAKCPTWQDFTSRAQRNVFFDSEDNRTLLRRAVTIHSDNRYGLICPDGNASARSPIKPNDNFTAFSDLSSSARARCTSSRMNGTCGNNRATRGCDFHPWMIQRRKKADNAPLSVFFKPVTMPV